MYNGTTAASIRSPDAAAGPLSPALSAATSTALASALQLQPVGSGVLSEESSFRSAGVIAEPELFQYSIHQGSEFLILASDGVWDKVRSRLGGWSGSWILLLDPSGLQVPHPRL